MYFGRALSDPTAVDTPPYFYAQVGAVQNAKVLIAANASETMMTAEFARRAGVQVELQNNLRVSQIGFKPFETLGWARGVPIVVAGFSTKVDAVVMKQGPLHFIVGQRFLRQFGLKNSLPPFRGTLTLQRGSIKREVELYGQMLPTDPEAVCANILTTTWTLLADNSHYPVVTLPDPEHLTTDNSNVSVGDNGMVSSSGTGGESSTKQQSTIAPYEQPPEYNSVMKKQFLMQQLRDARDTLNSLEANIDCL